VELFDSFDWRDLRDQERHSVGRCSLSSGKGHHNINVTMVAKTPKAKTAPKKNKPNLNLAPKEGDLALKKTKDGKIQKKSNTTQKRPLGKDTRDSIKAARMALAEGKVASDEQQRKHAMDLRTLYVRFKKSHPEGESEVREKLGNHPEIKFVRIPRQNQKNRNVRWAFVEFGSEAQCEAAKESLTKGAEAKDELYVDFVGVKSKSGGKPTQERGKRGKAPINPNRLFIGGLVEGLTEVKLKQLFPKCVEAVVKGAAKAGKGFAFIQFDNPGDAKAAFDASKKLTITGKSGSEGHHMTVVYARMNKSSVNKIQGQKSEKSKKSKGKKATELVAKSKDEAAEEVKEEATNGEDVNTDAATDKSQTEAVDEETNDSEVEDGGEGDDEAAKINSESEGEGNGENDAGSESDDEKDDDSESGEEADGDEEMENDAESSEDES